MNSMFNDFEVIHSYTRGQAIEDGYLIDVSKIAVEPAFLMHFIPHN
jgi:type I site-specific restriction endonuclease